MLTGAPPHQTIMQALAAQQSAECVGCLLGAIGQGRPPPRIREPAELSRLAQELLEAFGTASGLRAEGSFSRRDEEASESSRMRSWFTVVDARAHEWLAGEQSVHGGVNARRGSAGAFLSLEAAALESVTAATASQDEDAGMLTPVKARQDESAA